MCSSIQQSMFFKQLTGHEIIDITNKLKNKHSQDCFRLKMFVVKVLITSIIYPLTHICNLSLENGCVPKMLKMAKVLPMVKLQANFIITTNF